MNVQVRNNAAELKEENTLLKKRIQELEQSELKLKGSLQESEERYRSLVDNIDFGINLIDKDFKIITTNAVTGKQFNKSAGELVGKNCFKEFEKREAVCQHCPGVQAMATGQPNQVDTKGVRDDGSHFMARIRALPLFYPDGTMKGFTETIEDITERKRAEEALQERVKELKCLYSIADIIEKTDTIGEIYRQTADLMQNGLHYPEHTCARITCEDQEFQTKNFQETEWKISTEMIVHGKRVGVVEAYCLEEMPERDEGPFHKEERDLINAVAERLGKVTERKQYEHDLEKLISEALSQIKVLNGLLPICASCKKIRNDGGYWEQIESYIGQHSEAEFSHSICPDCARELYPEYYQEK